jgi:hypothetical protein
MMKKIGRNDPCPCGSGKKYKKCCLQKDEEKELRDHEDNEDQSRNQKFLPNVDFDKGPGDGLAEGKGFAEEERSIKKLMNTLNRYKRIKNTDEMRDAARGLLNEEKELPTDFAIEILEPIHNKLGSEGRHPEAIGLFDLLREKNRETYEDGRPIFDNLLIYHYIFLNDPAGVEMILEWFHSRVDQCIDEYLEILTALECSGHWITALKSCRRTREPVGSSHEIMKFGKDELTEKVTVLTFFEYVFAGEKESRVSDELFRTIQEYAGTDEKETPHYQRILGTLEGRDRTAWASTDFPYDDTGFNNLTYLSMGFVRWFEERHGLRALGLAESYREEALSYLKDSGEKTLLRFNHDKLAEHLSILLRFPSLQKHRAMLALEGIREFFIFVHEQGLTDANTLQEVNRSYAALLPQVKKTIGEELWKYSWRSFLNLN